MDFQIGPRMEVSLNVKLDPFANRGGPESVKIRFGAIKNYSEVCAFFKGLPKVSGDRFVAEIFGIKKTEKASWLLDLGFYGSIRIHCSHFDEI
jgi:hypothetical protein